MSIQKWGSPNSLALAIDFCDTQYFFLNWFIKFISALCYSSGSSSSTKCRGRASSSTICTPCAKASFLSTLTRYRHSRNCRAFAISRRCTMMEGETSAQCAFSRAILSASRRGTPPPRPLHNSVVVLRDWDWRLCHGPCHVLSFTFAFENRVSKFMSC